MSGELGHRWRGVQAALEAGAAHWIPAFFGQFPPEVGATVAAALHGGKRVRGGLLLLIHHALGGRLEDALPRAILIECIQAASLIHDDVIDGDVARRGGPAVWVQRGARRAVLLGDILFATALQRAAELDAREGRVLARAIAAVAAGAYCEPLEGRSDQALSYGELINRKTAALFAGAAELAAIAAGASARVRTAAVVFATAVGEAYQIADDLVDAERMGKRAYAQLLCYFLPDAPRDGVADVAPDRGLIRQRMRAQIDERLRRAGTALHAFPAGASTDELGAIAHTLVGLMLRESPTPAPSP